MRSIKRMAIIPAVIATCGLVAGCFSYHKTVDETATTPAPVVETVPAPVAVVPAPAVVTKILLKNRQPGLLPGSCNLAPPVEAAVNNYSRPGFTIVRDAVNLKDLAAQSGRWTDELLEDALAGYFDELAGTGILLDSRYDD